VSLALLGLISIISIVSCSKETDCSNRFDFVSSNDSIPIIELSVKHSADSICKEVLKLSGGEQSKDAWIPFKIPFKIESKKGFLKVLADFSIPPLMDHHLSTTMLSSATILLNQHDQLLFHGRPIQLDSLEIRIEEYILDRWTQESYRNINIGLIWTPESTQTVLYDVLASIYKAHLNAIERELNDAGKDICTLDEKEFAVLKERYELNIQFKRPPPPPLPVEELEQIGTQDTSEILEEPMIH